jgi:FkbM family methyltransferase
MKSFYRQFIDPGALCFDIGAHVGNRIRAWTALGARVVAVEPQPTCVSLLRRLYGGNPRVTLVAKAAGSRAGSQPLHVCETSPTLSTLSSDWIDRVSQASIFNGISWEESLEVEVTTMDGLIEEHGKPVFAKIDVEGYELEVLRGLTQPLDCLSFEYLPAVVETALSCIKRVSDLGDYRFNVSPVETMQLSWSKWVDSKMVGDYLKSQSRNGRSGDVYARIYVP